MSDLTSDERDLVLDLASRALVTDGSHHKQWYLEQIVFHLEGEMPEHCEEGVAP